MAHLAGAGAVGPMSEVSRIDRLLGDVKWELQKAIKEHAPMHSAHEGKSVIEEELDELWDEVKRKKRDDPAMRKEALHVAAMAVRFLLDVSR